MKILFVILLALPASMSFAVSEKSVVKQYAVIAHAVFEDALITAKTLQRAIDQLVAEPNEVNLNAAKAAWKQARVPYLQSEVFRFGNPNVDEWEGQLNAWPLDEGLIDYVTKDYQHELGNAGATGNIIANSTIQVGGEELDISVITPELLASLNELAGSEANIATGYHAIEFLLWGQDVNGTNPGAGNRPYTDFTRGKLCTHGHCERRVEYLKAVTKLLVSDLENMVQQWSPDNPDNYRSTLLALPNQQSLTRILYGMGSLSLGELAGERMKVALEANAPEDEQDCFSDNTHYAHFYNAKGVQNIYLGEYRRVNGTVLSGPGVSNLVSAKNSVLDNQTRSALSITERQLQAMVDLAESKSPMKFDQMIAPGNLKGEQIIKQAIASLVQQTKLIEESAKVLGTAKLSL